MEDKLHNSSCMPWKSILIFLCTLNTCWITVSQGQNRYIERNFQISLVPGISTNGINSGWYFNKYSLNIFSGIAAGSRHLEIGGISNLSLKYSAGIQIAGFANVVGSNAFINLSLREERELINDEEFRSYFKGLQVAGLVNFVRDDVWGTQLTGGFNVTNRSMIGLQVAGIGNTVNQHLSGVQFAGLYNIAYSSVVGIQISLLANITKGSLYGMQLGLINANSLMVGRNTKPPARINSMQIGLLNFSNQMTGIQIGLVNYAKEMGGIQIGLINIFSTDPTQHARQNGVPIGIINIGSKGHFTRISVDDQFLYNVERSTGNCVNCSKTQYEFPLLDRYQKYNQNAIIVSYNPSSMRDDRGYWGVGYRFERLMYIKYTAYPMRSGPQNRIYFLSWGAGIQHLNWNKKLHSDLSLLSSIRATYGRRFSILGLHYWYVAIRFNSYIYRNPDFGISNKLMIVEKSNSQLKYGIWPGFSLGLQL